MFYSYFMVWWATLISFEYRGALCSVNQQNQNQSTIQHNKHREKTTLTIISTLQIHTTNFEDLPKRKISADNFIHCFWFKKTNYWHCAAKHEHSCIIPGYSIGCVASCIPMPTYEKEIRPWNVALRIIRLLVDAF